MNWSECILWFLTVSAIVIAIVALMLPMGAPTAFGLRVSDKFFGEQITTAGQVLATGVAAQTGFINLDTFTVNTLSWAFTGGNATYANTFVPLLPGYYNLSYQVHVTTTTGGVIQTALFRNGAVIPGSVCEQSSGSPTTQIPDLPETTLVSCCAKQVQLFSGDLIQIFYATKGIVSNWVTYADGLVGSNSAAELMIERLALPYPGGAA